MPYFYNECNTLDKILIWVTFLVWLVFVIVHKIKLYRSTFWGISNNDWRNVLSLQVHMCVLDQTQLLMGLAVRRHYKFKTTWAGICELEKGQRPG